MTPSTHSLFLAVACVFAAIGGSVQDQRIGITIIKHQPCFPEPATPGASPTPAPMQFANSDQAPLVADDANPGCYKIKGDVTVREVIDGSFDTYAEVRSRMNQRPMACSSYDVNSDYGGYGTCIYGSNDCSSAAFKSTSVGIRSSSGTVQCGKSVHMNPGTVKDVELSFCMPTKADFIKAQNVTEATWKQLQNATKGNQRIYLTVYVFNTQLSQLMHAQRKWMQDKTNEQDRQIKDSISKGGDPNQPLGLPYDPTDEEFDNLPMQTAVHKQRKYIACHKVLADIFLPS